MLAFYGAMLCLAGGNGPTLVFGKDDLPRLREVAEQGPEAEVWARLKELANGYADPQAKEYANPATIDEGHTDRPQVIGHMYGRRLINWMEALGFAYQMTGDQKYADAGIAALVGAATKVPVSDPRMAQSFAGARGDFMRGLALGLDWLGEAMTQEQRQLVEAVAAGYVRNLLAEANSGKAWWVPHHNFMGVAGGAAGCLSLLLRDAFPNESPQWEEQLTALVRRWLGEGFDADGAYYEGVLYSAYGLGNGILFAAALERHRGVSLFDHPHLRQYPSFIAEQLLPGETVFEARNDSGYAAPGDPALLKLSGVWRDGLAKWLWDEVGSGHSPLRIVWHNDIKPVSPSEAKVPLAKRFEGRGLVVSRTGWSDSDLMFSMEAGPYQRVTHNQADKGSFTLYGLGQRWAIDSGYGNNRQPGGRDQSVAHNLVLIDGNGQALSGAGAGTNGVIRAFLPGDRYDYALADATEAYQRNNHNQVGVPVDHALRHGLFFRPSHGAPAYAVVLDDIRLDEAAHDYTWLLHTSDKLEVKPSQGGPTLVALGNASGEAYVETPLDATGLGAVEWSCEVAEVGEYTIWAAVRAGGPELGKSDSFMVSVDGGKAFDWHMPGAPEWRWGQVTRGVKQELMTFKLAAGEHLLRFGTREPGAQVDVVAIRPASAGSGDLTAKGEIRFEAESGAVKEPMQVVKLEHVEPPTMRVELNASAPISWTEDQYDGHPRLLATAHTTAPEFAAVLAPLPGGQAAPKVVFNRDAAQLVITVTWPQRVDTITWPKTGERTPVVSQQAR